MRSKIVIVVLSIIAGTTLLVLAVTNLTGCGKKREPCPPCPTFHEAMEILDGTRPKRPKGCGLKASGCPSVDDMLLDSVSRSFRAMEDFSRSEKEGAR